MDSFKSKALDILQRMNPTTHQIELFLEFLRNAFPPEAPSDEQSPKESPPTQSTLGKSMDIDKQTLPQTHHGG